MAGFGGWHTGSREREEQEGTCGRLVQGFLCFGLLFFPQNQFHRNKKRGVWKLLIHAALPNVALSPGSCGLHGTRVERACACGLVSGGKSAIQNSEFDAVTQPTIRDCGGVSFKEILKEEIFIKVLGASTIRREALPTLLGRGRCQNLSRQRSKVLFFLIFTFFSLSKRHMR